MKTVMSLIVTLATLASVSGGSIKMAPEPNIVRNAGQSIPLTFTCAGFTGQTVDFYLVNTKTWQRTPLEYFLPVSNGVNRHNLEIPWSWIDAGNYLVDVVGGGTHCTSTRVTKIRSAVLWPYSGTVYPANSTVSVVWNTTNVEADFLTVFLYDEDAQESHEISLDADPFTGRLDFQTPNVTGNHFRIEICGYAWVEASPEFGIDFYPEETEFTRSELVAIH